jgi:cobalt-zinc-cadmium efflux system membrane fusion protein
MARVWKVVRVAALGGLLVGVAGSAAWVAHAVPKAPMTAPERSGSADQQAIHRVDRDGIVLPPDVARKMGMRTAEATLPTRPITLAPFQGVLALDANGLARVPSRFAGEVMALGTVGGQAIRVGDPVRAGDLLAVVWSTALGEKKSELVAALSRLRLDEATHRRLKAAYDEGGGGLPERTVREAAQAVEADKIAVQRAERSLRSWRLTDAEIAAIRTEAKGLDKPDTESENWARVEVRSPRDGVVLECNVTVGAVVDTSLNLFQIGDLSHLAVWAHVYEEDLPLLQSLPKPVHWKVKLPSLPGRTFAGTLDRIGAVIDPNQHTALATGRVENANGELKVGQYVTVTVDLPPPGGQVEVPAEAVIEDGRESVVFVQPDPAVSRFVRTPVHVARRFRDVIYLRADAAGVHPGARVVTAGALLLHDAMDQLPASDNK